MIHLIEPDTHQDDWSARFVQEIEQWFRERYECDGGTHQAHTDTQADVSRQVPVQAAIPLTFWPR